MNPERFIELTQAYGAAPERWPLAERDDARALLERDDAAGVSARTALAEAREIDDALSAYQVSAPDQHLIDQVLASFHDRAEPVRRRPRRTWQWPRPRLWYSGIGLLGAGAAGIASGVMVVSLLYSASSVSPTIADQSYAPSVFSNAASDWSDE